MNSIRILPVPLRIIVPLAYTLTEERRNKTRQKLHAIAIKKNVRVKKLHVHELDTSASVYVRWSFCFSIFGGLDCFHEW